jgi:hypothetical protein
MHADIFSVEIIRPSHSIHRFRYNNTESRLKAVLDSSSQRIRLPLH